jgi:hypothetical protein
MQHEVEQGRHAMFVDGNSGVMLVLLHRLPDDRQRRIPVECPLRCLHPPYEPGAQELFPAPRQGHSRKRIDVAASGSESAGRQRSVQHY